MTTSLTRDALAAYVAAQMSSFFPDRHVAAAELSCATKRALDRLEHCLASFRVKYSANGNEAHFNHINTDQYGTYLYFLSNTLHRDAADTAIASKVYALNKSLHAIDIFYEVELPSVFLLQHPVGTVLGRATYNDYLMVYQRCSVGSSLEGDYPVIGQGVVMFGGSSIIGRSHVGPNAWLSIGTQVMNATIPPDTMVFGQSPNLIFKEAKRQVKTALFHVPQTNVVQHA